MSSGEIRQSVPCISCRYDLRGLPADGVCPECGERVARTLPHCPRCATTYKLIRVLDRLPDGSIGTWECDRCGGIAFERDRLRAVVAQIERPPVSIEAPVFDLIAQSNVGCTACRAEMDSIVLDSQAIIDRCRACGFIWIDVGEMDALKHFLKRNLGDAPAPRELEELLARPQALQAAAEGAERRAERAEVAKDAIRKLSWLELVAWLLGSS